MFNGRVFDLSEPTVVSEFDETAADYDGIYEVMRQAQRPMYVSQRARTIVGLLM
jgi:hypothetical protein